jgi:hypothetical protein
MPRWASMNSCDDSGVEPKLRVITLLMASLLKVGGSHQRRFLAYDARSPTL